MRLNQKPYKGKLLHIVVTIEVYEKLKKRGKMGESFNDVIKELLKK